MNPDLIRAEGGGLDALFTILLVIFWVVAQAAGLKKKQQKD